MTIQNNHSKDSATDNQRSLFGRRQGRALSPLRQKVLDSVLPKIEIASDLLEQSHSLDPSKIFDKPLAEYWLEIGFGHGEHLTALHRNNPDIGYMGAEPFITGMSAFLLDIENDAHDNIRIIMDDGMILARSLQPSSLDGLYILNPDPWHKKRHHKRRIVNQINLDVFAKVLKPGGQLILTTDVEDLAEWMCTQTYNHPMFEWSANSKCHWEVMPEDWITTRYQTKGAKNYKKMVYLFFNKKAE